MALGRTIAFAGALLWTALTTRCAGPAGDPVRDVAAEARALVHGLGSARSCLGDQHCTFAATRGVCALGTCLGLLSADQRPQRRVVLERIAAADPELAAALGESLRRAAAQPSLSAPSQLAVVEGLGALWQRSGCRDADLAAAVRAAMAGRGDAVAVTGRLQLGRCGDPAVLPDLLEDAVTGSELLRAESCGALAGYAGGADQGRARATLLERLADASPVVQRAAVVALRRWPTALPAAALADLRARAPHLAYLVAVGDAATKP